jgi:hypothetical protein
MSVGKVNGIRRDQGAPETFYCNKIRKYVNNSTKYFEKLFNYAEK